MEGAIQEVTDRTSVRHSLDYSLDDSVDAPQRRISRKLSVEISADAGELATTDRKKTGELDSSEQSTLRVQTLSGKVVLSLTRDEVRGLAVKQLKEMTRKAVGNVVDNTKLVFQVRELQDEESIEDLLAVEQSCEIVCITEKLPEFDESLPAMEQLETLKTLLNSSSEDYQFSSAQHIRKLLSAEQNPPIEEIIDLGVLPRLLELARHSTSPPLQFEALWALTNVASGSSEQTEVVVDLDAIGTFVSVMNFELSKPDLGSFNQDICEQAIWALGNIAGDCPMNRNKCVDNGVIEALIKILGSNSTEMKMSVKRNATWALSNLFRGKPPPCNEAVKPALPTLVTLLNDDDAEILTDACWGLSYFSDAGDENIDACIQAGVCQRLGELLSHTSPLVQTPALRCVGNFATGSETSTQAVIDSALSSIVRLLRHAKKSIRKEALWTLSNICAGSADQIQTILDCGCVSEIVQMMSTQDLPSKKEALWCISNICTNINAKHIEQVGQVVAYGCVHPVAELLLNSHDDKIQKEAANTMKSILEVTDEETGARTFQPVIRSCMDAQKLQRLEELGEQCEIAKDLFDILNYDNDVVSSQPNSYVPPGWEAVRKDYFGECSAEVESYYDMDWAINRGKWALDQTTCGRNNDFTEQHFKEKALILKKATSVAKAVELLNSSDGHVACPEGICIVYSESKKLYFLMFRQDKLKKAHQLFPDCFDNN